MKSSTLVLTLSLFVSVSAAHAVENHGGKHRMPDGTWMNNHDMPAAAAAQPVSATAVAGKRVVATVNGLVCDFCAQSVRKTLMREPGVRDAVVDLTAKTVAVSLTDGSRLAEPRLRTLLKDAGYDMTSYRAE